MVVMLMNRFGWKAKTSGRQSGWLDAPYQTLMNIFAPCIGVFLYGYLDVVITFSRTAREHVEGAMRTEVLPHFGADNPQLRYRRPGDPNEVDQIANCADDSMARFPLSLTPRADRQR